MGATKPTAASNKRQQHGRRHVAASEDQPGTTVPAKHLTRAERNARQREQKETVDYALAPLPHRQISSEALDLHNFEDEFEYRRIFDLEGKPIGHIDAKPSDSGLPSGKPERYDGGLLTGGSETGAMNTTRISSADTPDEKRSVDYVRSSDYSFSTIPTASERQPRAKTGFDNHRRYPYYSNNLDVYDLARAQFDANKLQKRELWRRKAGIYADPLARGKKVAAEVRAEQALEAWRRCNPRGTVEEMVRHIAKLSQNVRNAALDLLDFDELFEYRRLYEFDGTPVEDPFQPDLVAQDHREPPVKAPAKPPAERKSFLGFELSGASYNRRSNRAPPKMTLRRCAFLDQIALSRARTEEPVPSSLRQQRSSHSANPPLRSAHSTTGRTVSALAFTSEAHGPPAGAVSLQDRRSASSSQQHRQAEPKSRGGDTSRERDLVGSRVRSGRVSRIARPSPPQQQRTTFRSLFRAISTGTVALSFRFWARGVEIYQKGTLYLQGGLDFARLIRGVINDVAREGRAAVPLEVDVQMPGIGNMLDITPDLRSPFARDLGVSAEAYRLLTANTPCPVHDVPEDMRTAQDPEEAVEELEVPSISSSHCHRRLIDASNAQPSETASVHPPLGQDTEQLSATEIRQAMDETDSTYSKDQPQSGQGSITDAETSSTVLLDDGVITNSALAERQAAEFPPSINVLPKRSPSHDASPLLQGDEDSAVGEHANGTSQADYDQRDSASTTTTPPSQVGQSQNGNEDQFLASGGDQSRHDTQTWLANAASNGMTVEQHALYVDTAGNTTFDCILHGSMQGIGNRRVFCRAVRKAEHWDWFVKYEAERAPDQPFPQVQETTATPLDHSSTTAAGLYETNGTTVGASKYYNTTDRDQSTWPYAPDEETMVDGASLTDDTVAQDIEASLADLKAGGIEVLSFKAINDGQGATTAYLLV